MRSNSYISHYQKIEITNGLIESTNYQIYPIVNDHKKHKKPNRSNDKTTTSPHRTLTTARSLLLGNFKQGAFLLTLTFRPTKKFNTCDLTETDVRKVNFIKNMEKYYPGTKYFIVPELHKTGVVHYHCVTNLPYKLRDQARNVLWPYGFSTMKPIKDTRGLMYVTKYLSKTFKNPVWLHKHRYYASESLTRPQQLNDSESCEVGMFLDSWNPKPVITSIYESPYHGTIKYTAYLVGKHWLPHIRGAPFGTLKN
jgi:hypothetical protein